MQFLIIVAMLLAASPSLAQSPHEVDFNTVIAGPDGPFKECRQSDESGKCVKLIDLTLRSMCVSAAGMAERDAPIVEQVKHGKLATDLITADKLALSAEDVAFLKRQIAKTGYSTIAVYQAVKLLDPASVEK